MYRKHIFIPDTQVKPGVPTDHMRWIGEYIAEHKPDVVVHAGDHWDLPSLSSYDKGTADAEGRRLDGDLKAGADAMGDLVEPILSMAKVPEMHFCYGNHEDRLLRYAREHPELYSLLNWELFNVERYGWEPVPYLKVKMIDGIGYSHYQANPFTGRPYGGMARTRLNNVGYSFTMGHVQTLDMAVKPLSNGLVHRALICGACYIHDESYKGPYGNNHFRGLIVKNDVKDGNYALCEVSLDYLCRRYEGKPIGVFLGGKYPNMKGELWKYQ